MEDISIDCDQSPNTSVHTSGESDSSAIEFSPNTAQKKVNRMSIREGISPDYANQMQGALALYRAKNQRDAQGMLIYQPFLVRNLRYEIHGKTMEKSDAVMKLKHRNSIEKLDFFEKKSKLINVIRRIKLHANEEPLNKKSRQDEESLAEEYFEENKTRFGKGNVFLVLSDFTKLDVEMKNVYVKVSIYVDPDIESSSATETTTYKMNLNEQKKPLILDVSKTVATCLKNQEHMFLDISIQAIGNDMKEMSFEKVIEIFASGVRASLKKENVSGEDLEYDSIFIDIPSKRRQKKRRIVFKSLIPKDKQFFNYTVKSALDKSYDEWKNDIWWIQNAPFLMLKNYKPIFKRKIENDAKKSKNKKEEAKNSIPKAVKYRLFTGTEKINSSNDGAKPMFIESIMSSLKCIICQHKSPTLFHLLLHYHLNYPRLGFLLSTENHTKKDTEVIEVFLDPLFLDVGEVNRRRKHTKTTYWMVHPFDVTVLKQFYNLNPSIFKEFITDRSFVFEEDLMLAHQIMSETSRNYRDSSTCVRYSWPMPNCEVQITNSIKGIFEYIDVTYECKVFMATFNALRYKIGIDRSLEMGIYSFMKLYLFIHKDFIEEQGEQLKKHIMETLDYYGSVQKSSNMMLTYEQLWDLHQRFREPYLDPFDPKSVPMMLFPRMFREMCASAAKSKRKYIHPLFKTNTSMVTRNEDFCRHVFKEVIKQNVLPFSHQYRLLAQRPDEVLSIFKMNGIPKCLTEIPELPPNEDPSKMMVKLQNTVGQSYLSDDWYIVPKTFVPPENVEIVEKVQSSSDQKSV